MKQLFFIAWMLFSALAITACGDDDLLNDDPGEEVSDGNEGTEGDEDDSQGTGGANGENDRYLVLYCSRSGNTEAMARAVRAALDCDMVEVVPETPYDEDYHAMLERAQAELNAIGQGNYPDIATTVERFDEYDIVFIGYPIWYGHMATPMQTFLHENANRLAGKRIALFASSGSSGISTSVHDAQALVPDAVFTETLLLTSNTLGEMSVRIPAWLQALGASRETDAEGTNSLSMNIVAGGQILTATMEDNGAARDFLSRLPLEVTLNDYNNTEKIFYPDPELNLDHTPRGCAPKAGDITIYEPWGNVAIFYHDWTESNSLIKIGHIDGNGIRALSSPGSVLVRFERQ